MRILPTNKLQMSQTIRFELAEKYLTQLVSKYDPLLGNTGNNSDIQRTYNEIQIVKLVLRLNRQSVIEPEIGYGKELPILRFLGGVDINNNGSIIYDWVKYFAQYNGIIYSISTFPLLNANLLSLFHREIFIGLLLNFPQLANNYYYQHQDLLSESLDLSTFISIKSTAEFTYRKDLIDFSRSIYFNPYLYNKYSPSGTTLVPLENGNMKMFKTALSISDRPLIELFLNSKLITNEDLEPITNSFYLSSLAAILGLGIKRVNKLLQNEVTKSNFIYFLTEHLDYMLNIPIDMIVPNYYIIRYLFEKITNIKQIILVLIEKIELENIEDPPEDEIGLELRLNRVKILDFLDKAGLSLD